MIEFVDARHAGMAIAGPDAAGRYAVGIGCDVWRQDAPDGDTFDADGDGALLVGTPDELRVALDRATRALPE